MKFLTPLVIVVLFVALAILGYGIFKPISPRQPQKSTPTNQQPNQDLCTQFPPIEGEISCESAMNIALAKYPGKVLDIQKTTLPYQIERRPKGKTENRKVWLVRIKPNTLAFLPVIPTVPGNKETQKIDTIGVAVDRSTNEILFLQTFFKE